jgi:hemolysin D
MIQPLESGVVKTIFVEEGQLVEVGELLIELDTTASEADSERLAAEQLALKLDRARIESVLAALRAKAGQVIGGSVDADAGFANLSGATEAQVRLQRKRSNKQLVEYWARVAALEDEERQKRAERAAVTERINQLDATVPLITERVEALAKLLEQDLVARTKWLELEQARIEQVKERDVQKNNLAMLEAAIASIKKRQAVLKAEFEKRLLDELSDLENRIAAFEQELIKARQRVTLQQLRAPVTGTVQQLAVHTIGGVVTPAQELMLIVPQEGALQIEAWIPNKDIGFVHEGQATEIKVETFPFTKYGTIDGELINVSNDAVPNEDLGLVYAVQVAMGKTTMRVKDKPVNLSPGMAVTVEVNMGKRRLIEYLLSPLLRYRDESIRER